MATRIPRLVSQTEQPEEPGSDKNVRVDVNYDILSIERLTGETD